MSDPTPTIVDLNFDEIYTIRKYQVAKRFETGDLEVEFNSKFLDDHPELYVFFVYKIHGIVNYVPILDKKLVLGPSITNYPGDIDCQLIVKTSPIVDGTTGFLRNSEIFKLNIGGTIYDESINDQELDPTIQLVYEELLALINEVESKLANGDFSPKIGENNHWYINDVDTGVSATGPSGKAPRLSSSTNNWEVYDDASDEWIDTGVSGIAYSTVLQYDSYLQFPALGKPGYLYIDESSGLTYYFNTKLLKYKTLSAIPEVLILDGGQPSTEYE